MVAQLREEFQKEQFGGLQSANGYLAGEPY